MTTGKQLQKTYNYFLHEIHNIITGIITGTVAKPNGIGKAIITNLRPISS